jgi:hypothetical protein
MFESMDPQNPNLFKPGSLSVSRALALGLPMLAMGGVFAARRFRDKLRLRDSGGVEEMRERPVLQGTGVPVGGRPVSVTVISWILIATAVIGLLAWILMAFGPGKRQLENITRIWGMSVGVQILFGLAGNTIMLVCGFFLLRGRNWARWTIVVFFAIGFLLSIWFYGSVALLLPGLIWIAAFVFFLFVRTPAARYFGARARERAR